MFAISYRTSTPGCIELLQVMVKFVILDRVSEMNRSKSKRITVTDRLSVIGVNIISTEQTQGYTAPVGCSESADYVGTVIRRYWYTGIWL